uniref:Uncharacterized protein n=1 Tax=Micrurus spixii TaxID=129469 RepID=A0A2D4LTF4_9SAUR
MKVNVEKSKVLHPGRKNRFQETWLKNSNCDRVRMDNHLNMSHMCAAAAKQVNTILDCINGGIESKSREVLVPFYKALVSSSHSSYYLSLPTYDYNRVDCIFTIYIVLFVP